ncbi:MAG: TIGR02234 family membrane protein, partial [Stackebrandtia sp.]
MKPKRDLAAAVLTTLAAGGLGLYAATRVWSQTEQPRPHPLPPETVSVAGVELAAWTAPAAVVVMASALA